MTSSRPMLDKAQFVPGVLDFTYRATIKTVVFAVGIVLVVATLKALFGDYIVIEPISVPRQVEEDGYSGAVVARRLMGELHTIGQFGNDLYLTQNPDGPQERIRFRSEDDFSSLTTVSVPSSSISLRSMAQALREFLGFPEKKVSGEITLKRGADGKTASYRLVLRISSPLPQDPNWVEADTVDEAIHRAAPSIAEQFDPVGLASYHLRKRNGEETNRLAAKLMAESDPDLKKQGFLLRGAQAFLDHKNDEAIGFFKAALEQDRRLGEAYNSWGATLANQGQWDAAIAKYQQALELNPSNYTAYINRGWARRAKGERELALQDFEQAAKLNPRYPIAYLDRGVIFLDKDDLDRAMQDFDFALKLDPTLAFALNNRAMIYRRKGETDRALRELDEAIRIGPASAVYFFNRGSAHLVKGDTAKALEDLDRAIKLDSKMADAFILRGMTYSRKAEYERAIQDYDQALQIVPDSAEVLNDRCYGKAILGRLDSAISDCNDSLRLRPGDVATLDSRGFAYLKSGFLNLAIADYDAALKLEPTKAYSLFGRGIAKRRQGDSAGGDADIAAAENSKPGVTGEMAKLGLRP